MFGQIFSAVFLGVFFAMWLMRGMDEFSRDHRRWKQYCKAQVKDANTRKLMVNRAGLEPATR